MGIRNGDYMACEMSCKGVESGANPIEQSAINALLQYLNGSGSSAAFRCFAEGAPCSWTMDAVLEVEGEVWIVDHTRVTWQDRSAPWMREADTALRSTLESIAQQIGMRITTMVPDLRGAGDSGYRGKVYRSFLEEMGTACSAENKAALVPLVFIATRDGFSYQLLPVEGEESKQSGSLVGIGFSMAHGRDLRSQFTEFNLPTVLSKLTKQLAPAFGNFDHAGLLLDQRYVDGEVPPLTNSVLTIDAIYAVLDSTPEIQDSLLDRVWIIDDGHVVQEVWGRNS